MRSLLTCTFYSGHLNAFAVVLINLKNRNGIIWLLVCLNLFLGKLFFFCTLEDVDEVCMTSNNLAPWFRLSDKGTLPPRNRKCYLHKLMFEN